MNLTRRRLARYVPAAGSTVAALAAACGAAGAGVDRPPPLPR